MIIHVIKFRASCILKYYGNFNVPIVILRTRLLVKHLGSKEIKPVIPKGNQLWIFIGKTDAEPEAPILWLPDTKSQLFEKYLEAGKDWRQEKGTTEDEMVGWHHRHDGHEFEIGSGSWWWTGRPGVLRFMGSQRVGHD